MKCAHDATKYRDNLTAALLCGSRTPQVFLWLQIHFLHVCVDAFINSKECWFVPWFDYTLKKHSQCMSTGLIP